MTWNVLQSASGGGTGSSLAVTYGSNASSGSKLIAWVVCDAASALSVSSVKDGAGNSFTQMASASGSVASNNITVACYAIDTPAGDVGTAPSITVTLSGTSSDVSMLIQEVSGLASGDAHDGTPGTSTPAGAASIAQPAYTSSAAGEYLVTFFGDTGITQTFTLPSGYTADAHNVNASNTNDIAVGYKSSTGGSESGTWTFTGSSSGSPDGFIVVAFKLPAGGAVPSRVLPLQAPPQAPPPPPPPRSQVIPFLGALTGTALLSGSGALTAAPFFSGAATLSGSGTLTATFTTAGTAPYVIQAAAQPPQPPRPPASQVVGSTPAVAFTGAATLSGTGTLAAAPYFDATGTVLSGSGTLAAAYTTAGTAPYVIIPVAQPPQPAQPPPGRVINAPSAALLASATLSGTGTLAAAPYFSAAALFSGSGTLTAAYTVAGAPPYVITAVIQPPQPAQPPPGHLLGVPPPPPPPVLQSATIAATAGEGTTMTATVSDQATTKATVSEQASITASVT